MADLEYNIESRLLTGTIGGTVINARAGSGGRAGSKEKDAENWWLANNSLATHITGNGAKGSASFGPLPRGLYTLTLHETKSNWIRLNPNSGNQMFQRAGFAIHGRGKTGSHGCIVPSDFNVVLKLCQLIRENSNKGGPPISLLVVSRGQDIGIQNRTA